jgi:hypothetical protein
MRLKSGKWLIVVGGLVISAVMLLSLLIVTALFTQESKGHNFLRQLEQGNEEAAEEYVSAALLDQVRLTCTRGWLTGCYQDLTAQEWGGLREIVLAAVDSATGDELYHLRYTGLEQPVSVVVRLREIEGSRVVTGWRGWVISEGDAADAALLRGENAINALMGDARVDQVPG